jgi:hypothetical protein
MYATERSQNRFYTVSGSVDIPDSSCKDADAIPMFASSTTGDQLHTATFASRIEGPTVAGLSFLSICN